VSDELDNIDVSIAMPDHIGDWKRETDLLSLVERGAHHELRQAAWTRGGYLPLASDRLARLVGVDATEWSSIWAGIGPLWSKTDDGRIYQARMLVDLERARTAKRAAIARGQESARIREERKAKSKQSGDEVETVSKQSGDERETPTPSPTPSPDPSPLPLPSPSPEKNTCPSAKPDGRARRGRASLFDYSEAFGTAWKAYPRRDGKAKAWTTWIWLAGRNGGEQTLLASVTDALKWQVPHWRATDREFPQHVPYLASYLNGRRWEDEKPVATPKSHDVRHGFVRAEDCKHEVTGEVKL
jgi:uncharacterized protein YdaU (DUF1376 family)